MDIILDKKIKMPVYVQIAEQIKTHIRNKELLPGMQLPPERKLAALIQVNRSTVLNAYDRLKQEGYIEARVGCKTVVVDRKEHSDQEQVQVIQKEPCWNQLFNVQVKAFDTLLLQEAMPFIDASNVISFGLGIASREEEPMLPFDELANEVQTNQNCKALLMAPIGGFLSLRTLLAGLMRKKGIPCTSEQVMVLSGSQQGIDLSARILIEPGDIVVVEAPSYFLGLQSLKAAGARIMEIPIDRDGMRIDLLEQLLKRYHPKMIYTMPNYQNPSSVCMSLERRKKLVELALRHDIILLEDDAYGDFHYEGDQLPSLASLDTSGHVILVKTFSKTVSPGLRLGYMVAHKKIIETCSLVRQGEDVHPNSISQWLVERYYSKVDVQAYLKSVCCRYQKKRDQMYDALRTYAPTEMQFFKPKGGIYIWCHLPPGVRAKQLLEQTLTRKVSFMPGNSFFLGEEGQEYIRLNFSCPKVEEIETGICIICEEVKKLTNNQRKETISNSEIIPMY